MENSKSNNKLEKILVASATKIFRNEDKPNMPANLVLEDGKLLSFPGELKDRILKLKREVSKENPLKVVSVAEATDKGYEVTQLLALGKKPRVLFVKGVGCVLYGRIIKTQYGLTLPVDQYDKSTGSESTTWIRLSGKIPEDLVYNKEKGNLALLLTGKNGVEDAGKGKKAFVVETRAI